MDNTEGGNVASHAAVALGHREVSNADELVDGGATTEEDFVSNPNVSGDQDIVGENVVVSNGDIVREMRDGHEKIAVADDGVAACFGAAINSDVFAEGIVISNEDTRFDGGIKRKILRIATDDSSMVDNIVFAHGNAATDFSLGGNPATGSKNNSVFNDCEWPNFDIFCEKGGFGDESLRMNPGHYEFKMKVATDGPLQRMSSSLLFRRWDDR